METAPSMAVMGICLALASAVSLGSQPPSIFVPIDHFTLAWTHSIEKIRWEEDYAVVNQGDPAKPPILRALKARVHGSGAGMEPPADARLRDGWYEYTPTLKSTTELRLTRSEFTPDYDLCPAGRCQALSHWLPSDGDVTLLRPCRQTTAN